MRAGDTSNQFRQNNGFAETCTTEQAGFTTPHKRRQKVNHLDARFEDLCFRREFFDGRCLRVDGTVFSGLDLTTIIDRVTEHVEHSTESGFTHGDGDRSTSVDAVLTADHTVSTSQSDATDATAT